MELSPEIVGASLTVLGGAFGIWKYVETKISQKADTAETEALWKENAERKRIEEKLFGYHKEHEEKDNERFERIENSNRDRHDELMSVIGDMRADMASLKR